MNSITVVARQSGSAAYQVVPDPDEPILLQLDGSLTRILEISAIGFLAPGDAVHPGRRYPFTMDLPSTRLRVRGYVDVLPATGADELDCRFVDLAESESDALHHYVLIRQKEAIRALRAGRPKL